MNATRNRSPPTVVSAVTSGFPVGRFFEFSRFSAVAATICIPVLSYTRQLAFDIMTTSISQGLNKTLGILVANFSGAPMLHSFCRTDFDVSSRTFLAGKIPYNFFYLFILAPGLQPNNPSHLNRSIHQ